MSDFKKSDNNINDFFASNEPEQNDVSSFFYDEPHETQDSSQPLQYEEFSEDELIEMIVEKSCGKDADGIPKGALNLTYEKINKDTKKSQTLRELSINTPEVAIFKRMEFVQIDLIFASPLASDLKIFWNTFERFGRDFNNLNDETINIPFLSLTIIPVEENGKYYITCTNPVLWTLQPSSLGGSPNMLRILYRAEDMNFFEAEGFSEAEIEAASLRMLQEKERQAVSYYEKQQQELEYQEKQNRQIENSRYNN